MALRRRSGSLGVAAVAVAIGVAAPREAVAVPIAIDWRAPASRCPSQQELADHVARLRGEHRSPVHWEVRIDVEEEVSGWRLELTARSPRGSVTERTLRGSSCRQVTDAAALVLALALGDGDGDGVEDRVAAQTSSPRVAWPRRIAVGALGLAEVGSLPTPSMGVAMFAAAGIGPLALAIRGTLLAESTQSIRPEAGARFRRAALAFGGCGTAWRAVTACTGLETGIIDAQAFGITHPRAVRTMWWAIPIDLRGSVRLSRSWSVVGELGASFPLSRPVFFIEPIGDAHRVPAVVGHAGLGLEAAL